MTHPQLQIMLLANLHNLIPGEDLILNDLGQGRVFDTTLGIVEFFQAFFVSGFQDARVELVAWETQNTGFTLETRLYGCQDGPFMGIPATGRKISLPLTLRGRLETGRLRYLEFDYDAGDLLRQLGLAL